MIPSGVYVLLKRFSAKEERKRIVACLCNTKIFCDGPVGIENHINYIHCEGHGLPQQLAKGLTCYLNSTLFDLAFRQISGSTQVNATDIRRMPFPSTAQLITLGKRIGNNLSNQEKIDKLCDEELFPMEKRKINPATAQTKISQALDFLKAVGMPKEQQNERSALTLLALLHLQPDTPWSKAKKPLIGITQMMDYFFQQYGKKYAPNTRETVRRQTVHQFVDAGLAISNPDKPDRPINSPKWCYQVSPEMFNLVLHIENKSWGKKLSEFRHKIGSLKKKYAQLREMKRIPIVLSNGATLSLSPGGQNDLVKYIIGEFCPRFVASGNIIYE